MIAKQHDNLEVAHPTGFEPVTSAFGVRLNVFLHVPPRTDKLPQACF